MKRFRFPYVFASALLLCGCSLDSNSSLDESSSESEIVSSLVDSEQISSKEDDKETAFSTGSEEETESTGSFESEASTEAEPPAEAESSSETEIEIVPDTSVEPETETETESETNMLFYSCDDIMYVTTDARIRTGPSLDASVYDVLKKGTRVQTIAKSEEWYIISVGMGTYYIYAELLSSENPSADVSPDGTSEQQTVPAADGSGVTSSVTENGTLYSVGNGPLVCIDAGHQAHGNSTTEPNGPGSTVMKAKVTTGTSGVASGITEAALNLTVSLKLRDELISRGYNVLMIRETAEVDISNAQRAQMANAAGSDIFIRIHANGSEDQSVSGVLTMSPSAANPYISSLYSACRTLSECVVNGICAKTGAVNKGVYETDTMTGINWCTEPVTIVEMGYMSNPTEDLLLATEDYQAKIVSGIADGVDMYFGR